MTKEEAIYWKNYIDKVVSEKLDTLEVSDADAIRISDFAKRYMQVITGQQYVPQGLFREFLELFAKIPAIQEEIRQMQEGLAANMPESCTDKDLEQTLDGLMWDDEWMYLPSMDIDEDGFVALNIEIDANGWAHFVDD
ncbi:MAG: hypothetical protein IJQ84_05950 [Paludibacteraceae bacterium]|nr:hypothetical protein [Paludibacteraceae bacterium]MBR0065395.1 hypothetical protein [Paludibacteraceae bacterium]